MTRGLVRQATDQRLGLAWLGLVRLGTFGSGTDLWCGLTRHAVVERGKAWDGLVGQGSPICRCLARHGLPWHGRDKPGCAQEIRGEVGSGLVWSSTLRPGEAAQGFWSGQACRVMAFGWTHTWRRAQASIHGRAGQGATRHAMGRPGRAWPGKVWSRKDSRSGIVRSDEEWSGKDAEANQRPAPTGYGHAAWIQRRGKFCLVFAWSGAAWPGMERCAIARGLPRARQGPAMPGKTWLRRVRP